MGRERVTAVCSAFSPDFGTPAPTRTFKAPIPVGGTFARKQVTAS